MIRAKTFKLEWSGYECSNPSCSHNEKYHYNLIGKVFHIKQNEIVLAIAIGNQEEIYCRECIDIVYKKLKPVLDSKLWILT